MTPDPAIHPRPMAGDPPDQAARTTISRSGLDRTLFVEAGAGTGKTTQLVDRIANLVMVQGVRLASVAAITFTEAAAAELRDRVRVRFEQLATEAVDPVQHQRAVDALADSDLAAISTLHGFAQRILGEHPGHSGLPPRIGVLDEVSSTLERAERWEAFVDRIYDDPANEDLLVRAAALDIAVETAYAGQSSLEAVALKLDQSWDRLGPAAERQHPPLPAVDFGPFDRAVADLASLADLCVDRDDRFYLTLCALQPRAEVVLAHTDPLDKLRALVGLDPWGPGAGGRAAAWTVPVQEAKALVTAVAEARAEVLGRAGHEVLTRLVSLIAADLVRGAETRRVEGRLEFHDLLVFALRLLRTSPSARTTLHHRYTHLLLDEFQDTDPLQIHLAVLIAATIAGDEPPSWQDAEVEPGRLFFVGDPKQSIYRFRRADIELFLEARDRFGTGGSLQRLSTNFRTVGPVIDWINSVFGGLMPTEVEGMQPAYEPLHAHRRPSADADHRPVVLGGPHPGAKADAIRAAETAEVAAVVADIHRHPHRWPVGIGDGRWRPATLADVTVLIPTRTELPALQRALAELDLPHHLATGTLIFQTQEVRDVLSALAAVDDPSDELTLVATLRSPLYGCRDVDLFTFHQAGGRWDVRQAPPAVLGPHHPVAEALVHLRSLWERRWWVRPSQLLCALIDERRASMVAFGGPTPEESWSRLRFIVDQAMAFDEAGGGDLRAFLHWADLQRDESVTVHQPVARDGAGEAVSIMTIHGAKGLEFPITIVSGTSAAPRPVRGPAVVFGPDGLPGVHLRKGIATIDVADALGREATMAEHEQLRLLYVAATRARDHLVVSAHHRVNRSGAGNRSFGHHIWDSSQAAPELWRRHEPLPAPAPTPADVDQADVVDPDQRRAWARARQELLDSQRASRTISATAIAAGSTADAPTPGGPGPEGLDPEDLAPEDGSGPGPGARRRRGRAGTAIGRAAHATLQLVDLHDPSHLAAEAQRQAHLESIPELAGTVAAMVRSALDAPTVRGAERFHREVYVAAPVGRRVVEGYIDLLIETDDGLVVVDYKTDHVRSEADIDAKLATYELQGAAYAVALEAATGLVVAEVRFVFCRPTGAIERSVADLGGAMTRVRLACEHPGDAPRPAG